jgi:hypothetical protein
MKKAVTDRDNYSIMKWINEDVCDGENSIVIYPEIPSFRQIYMQYSKQEFANQNLDEMIQKLPRIVLIASFYETIENVKNDIAAVGVDIHRFIDDGSLVIIDSFASYYPDISGMKKLVASLSRRATTEGRPGVTAIINMGAFFLYGSDGEAMRLINYEASKSIKTIHGTGNNVRGFNCYNIQDYDTLSDEHKKQIGGGKKNQLEIIKSID